METSNIYDFVCNYYIFKQIQELTKTTTVAMNNKVFSKYSITALASASPANLICLSIRLKCFSDCLTDYAKTFATKVFVVLIAP